MLSYSRSIGVQVNLCGCTYYLSKPCKGLSNSKGNEVKKLDKANIHLLNDPNNFPSLMSGEGEKEPILEMQNEECEDKVFEDNDKCTNEESSRLLAQEDVDENGDGGKEPCSSHHHSSSSTHHGSSSSPNHPSNSQETLSPIQKTLPQTTTSSSTQKQTVRTSSNDSISATKRESHSSYHFKRKFANFRSDSVFSDVMPIAGSSVGSTHDPRKGSDPCDNTGGGSLGSLKPKESKWVSLRKKLKINVSSNSSAAKEKDKNKSLEHKNDSGGGTSSSKPIPAKRTLFQRAKTLAMIPVKGSSRDGGGEEHHHHHHHHRQPKPPKPQYQPPELFNVGGEMNMIPLELLIDVSELNINKKS